MCRVSVQPILSRLPFGRIEPLGKRSNSLIARLAAIARLVASTILLPCPAIDTFSFFPLFFNVVVVCASVEVIKVVTLGVAVMAQVRQ
jgi:hypothetical protein